ncbi:MAG: glycosyltransferase family 2 protein [Lachnospiraceae bacterium]|jgi:glycosyltransferase involved in cell wall biosynthesis|nr:glycosyltransferase family 2 protein [Lachnospiraceae bacterium]
MFTHTYAICAYKDSPYLEHCIRSLKRQSIPAAVILCTSTPSLFLEKMAGKYKLPYYVREGESDIQADWNFAYKMADSDLVTIAHQDDIYHRDYGKYVRQCWKQYPDTSVFTTDCALWKDGRIRRHGMVLEIKRLLRIPLRLRLLANQRIVKKAVFVWGNPVICPSCTYNKKTLGYPLFHSSFKFALDWDTMWQLASQPGRFVCEEKSLICYRIHKEATTKACIKDQRRPREELAMYQRIWPLPMAKLWMHFYKKAYDSYD